MQKITKKRFFDLIMGGASAKIGAPRYSGNVEVDDAVVAKLANEVKEDNIEKLFIGNPMQSSLKNEHV